MTHGWYSLTEAYVNKLELKDVMIWAKIYDLDLDEDIDEIRKQVADIMSRKTKGKKDG